MPLTPIYQFPFEEFDDQPGHSLHGGQAGTEPILAEEVEQALNAIETGSLADLTDRIAALEATALLQRWETIEQGTWSGPAFSVLVPSNYYSRIRLTMLGDMDGDGTVSIRINGDSTAGLHRYGLLVRDAAGVLDTNTFADATTWHLAQWGTTANNQLIAEIVGTDGAEFTSFTCTGARHSASATSHRLSHSWGRLVESRIVSSINIRPNQTAGVSMFATTRYWLEGYRETP